MGHRKPQALLPTGITTSIDIKTDHAVTVAMTHR
jgi:muramoyltetrapeptide carboxypeptidase LdcA involved in peptidoglycan recycling